VACETICTFLRFFTFFQNPKNMTFYVFWVVAHVFSNIGLSHERNVRPSVRLSVKRVNSDNIKHTCAYILISHMKGRCIYFSDTKNSWWRTSPSTRNFRPYSPTHGDLSLHKRYSLVPRKRQHLAKKSSIITNRKLTTSFPMSLRWTSPQRGLKNAKWPIFVQKCM